MAPRLLLLVALYLGLVALNPAWVVIDWGAPIAWLSTAPTEDAAAAVLRAVALALTGSQIIALGVLGLSTLAGGGRLERAARRALLPIFRGAGPIALIAGTALPVAAMEAHLPITPPPVTRVIDIPDADVVSNGVTVRPGDSMWTIAAGRVEGDPSVYWRRLVDLNRDRFENVDLIHPGDTVLLPPLN
jgi:nucleoid-associated protein YgaU